MKRKELIEQLIADTLEVKKDMEELATLPIDQLSQQPSSDQWSVLQCIEHLNIADAHYILQMEDKLPQAEKSPTEDFKGGLLGNYFVKMIKPQDDGTIPSPMKTFSKFRPQVDVKYDTIEKFLEDHDKIISSLELAKELDLNKNKIPSALGSIIMFKLGDAFRFLIGHNQRHIIQMRNVLAEIGTLEASQ